MAENTTQGRQLGSADCRHGAASFVEAFEHTRTVLVVEHPSGSPVSGYIPWLFPSLPAQGDIISLPAEAPPTTSWVRTKVCRVYFTMPTYSAASSAERQSFTTPCITIAVNLDPPHQQVDLIAKWKAATIKRPTKIPIPAETDQSGKELDHDAS